MCQQDLVNDGEFGGYVKSKHTICQVLGRKLHENPTGLAVQVVVSARYTQNVEGLAYSYGDGAFRCGPSTNTVLSACHHTNTHAPCAFHSVHIRRLLIAACDPMPHA